MRPRRFSLKAAKQLESLDCELARATYLDALAAATVVGRLATTCGLREVATAALGAPPAREPERASDLLLNGLALLITKGYAPGAPPAKRALTAFRDEHLPIEDGLRWLWFAAQTALDLWDDDSWEVLAERHITLARDVGALAVLPSALSTRVGVHLGAGEFAEAESLLEEVRTIAEATGSHLAPYVSLALAALRGREAEVSRLSEVTLAEVELRGEGVGLSVVHWARAVLYNGLGRYDEALAAAQHASGHPEELWFSA